MKKYFHNKLKYSGSCPIQLGASNVLPTSKMLKIWPIFEEHVSHFFRNAESLQLISQPFFCVCIFLTKSKNEDRMESEDNYELINNSLLLISGVMIGN